MAPGCSSDIRYGDGPTSPNPTNAMIPAIDPKMKIIDTGFTTSLCFIDIYAIIVAGAAIAKRIPAKVPVVLTVLNVNA